MANIVRLRITGMDSLRKTMEDVTKREFQEALAKEMDKEADFIVERARLNAPILSGDLRNNLEHSDPVVSTRSNVTVDFGVEDPEIAVYAIRWHENEFNLGPVSARQPGTVEGGVGNKYITRVWDYHGERILRRLTQAVLRLVKGE